MTVSNFRLLGYHSFVFPMATVTKVAGLSDQSHWKPKSLQASVLSGVVAINKNAHLNFLFGSATPSLCSFPHL